MFDVIVRINYVRMSQAHNGFQKWLRRNNISKNVEDKTRNVNDDEAKLDLKMSSRALMLAQD